MRRLLVALPILLAACGGSEEAEQPPPDLVELDAAMDALPDCADLIGEPTPVDPTCDQGDDRIATSASKPCADGRTLRWNDGVIGYEGERAQAYTMTLLQDMTEECG